jgi:hypothetical protein
MSLHPPASRGTREGLAAFVQTYLGTLYSVDNASAFAIAAVAETILRWTVYLGMAPPVTRRGFTTPPSIRLACRSIGIRGSEVRIRECTTKRAWQWWPAPGRGWVVR